MNNEVKKVFFIVNKYSGTGFTPDFELLLERTCSEHGVAFSLAYTEAPRHATLLASTAAREGYDRVIAVGGDGTVNEVAQGLLHTSTAMGIIPKGSGNGLARHMQIPLKTHAALTCMLESTVAAMDTFRLNGHLSLNVSGIGFDGYIAGLFSADKKRGLEGYTRLVLNEFMDFPEFDAEITTGGETFTRKAFVIALANSSQYGNNAKIAPAASILDGTLDLSILKKVPPYRLDFIYSFFTGTIDQSAYCETRRVRDLAIRLHRPVAFHIDGEAAGTADTFQVEMLPASLKVMMPCDAASV